LWLEIVQKPVDASQSTTAWPHPLHEHGFKWQESLYHFAIMQ